MPARYPNLYLREGVWWARLKVAGREYRRSLRTAGLREAQGRLRQLRDELEHQSGRSTSPLSFREAVVRWGTKVLPEAVKPAVMRRYLVSIRALDQRFGGMRVADIGIGTIAAWVTDRSGTVTNATIRRDLTALSMLLSSCCAWGEIAQNPVLGFDRRIVRERREPIDPPSRRDVETLLAAAPVRMQPIIRLLDQTGMREQEAVTLEWRDVDWDRCQISLIRTKTSRPRTLHWATPAGDAGPVLTALQGRHGPLFPTRSGEPYRNFATFFAKLSRDMAAVELKAERPFRRFRAHDLRHAFAIRWLRNGGDIYRLSRHLGHKSVKTTEIYLDHLSEADLDVVRGGITRGTTDDPTGTKPTPND